MREILLSGKSAAYLFGINPETYAIVNQPGRNVIAALRAETKKQVAIVADRDCGPAEVRVLIEGKAGVDRARAAVGARRAWTLPEPLHGGLRT